MKYWYFKFEGEFAKNSLEYPGKGVFSSCLIPANYTKAESALLDALRERKIKLVEIEEHFTVDDENIDLEDEENEFWIEWCEEVKDSGKPVFEKLHLFPKNTSH